MIAYVIKCVFFSVKIKSPHIDVLAVISDAFMYSVSRGIVSRNTISQISGHIDTFKENKTKDPYTLDILFKKKGYELPIVSKND